MYKINSVEIENDVLVSHATITMKDNYTLDVTVRVKLPDSAEQVLKAIDARYDLEIAKYDSAPVMNAIKDEIDLKFTGKPNTEFVRN